MSDYKTKYAKVKKDRIRLRKEMAELKVNNFNKKVTAFSARGEQLIFQ